MNEFLKMDVFFVVTTVIAIIVGILVCVVLYYFARFLRTLNRIADEIEEETQVIRADIREARDNIKREGVRLRDLFSFFGKSARKMVSRKKRS
jgi:uncharacterized membrane protein (DUF106 family)